MSDLPKIHTDTQAKILKILLDETEISYRDMCARFQFSMATISNCLKSMSKISGMSELIRISKRKSPEGNGQISYLSIAEIRRKEIEEILAHYDTRKIQKTKIARLPERYELVYVYDKVGNQFIGWLEGFDFSLRNPKSKTMIKKPIREIASWGKIPFENLCP